MNELAGLTIGLVGPVPPPAGGMAMQTRQLAELLQADQARVDFVPTHAPTRPAWVADVRWIRALFRIVPYVFRLWRTAGRCDVIHVMANSGWSWHLYAAPAVWIAKVRKVPIIVNYRGGEAPVFLRRSGRVVAATMRRASRLVVPSAFLRETFARHGMTAGVVPNIVDLSVFRPGEPVPPPQIFVARNLEAIYGIDTAVRAFARVRQVHSAARLVVAGTGPEEGFLRSLVHDLHLDDAVEFTGRMERETLAVRLRESSVALNPSRVDNMPNSLLEALASGVPIVSTDVGGIPHLVEREKTALLVPHDDPEAMARAVLRLLGDPDLAARLRHAGLTAADAYGWNAVRPLWCATYRAVVGAA